MPSTNQVPIAEHLDTDLRPGDIGQVVSLHGREYATIAGFGTGFEALIAAGLGEFVQRADPFSKIWLAREATGDVVGSIAIDRSHEHGGAHLRWFLIDRNHRGSGLGQRLLATALDHCDQHSVEQTMLWTFAGLDTARALYERHAFTLAREQAGNRWGTTLVEQLFLRTVEPPSATTARRPQPPSE